MAQVITAKIVAVNTITATRLLIAPFVIWAVVSDNWGLAIPLLLSGFATDLIDGWLARKWSATTTWGGHLDAQADRVLLVSPIVGMAIGGKINPLLALTLVLGVWLADLLAGSFELMRIVWWPILYAVVAWGMWQHSSPVARMTYVAAAMLSFAIVLWAKRNEAKKALGGLRRKNAA